MEKLLQQLLVLKLTVEFIDFEHIMDFVLLNVTFSFCPLELGVFFCVWLYCLTPLTQSTLTPHRINP